MAPGEPAYCQIVLAEPVAVLRGDRFILRDETAQRTLGGGIVILPAAPKHKRSDPALLRQARDARTRRTTRRLFAA